MNLSKIDLNLFVVFDAILGEGGISAAARKLNLSQPAVSHALNRLRDTCGDPLFERHGQAMVPTPMARALAEPARAALVALESALHGSARFDPAGSARRFVISLRDSVESSLLPSLMHGFCGDAPNVELATVRGDRRQLEAELLNGTLDAAIDILLPLSAAVRHQRVMTERMVVLARRNHPGIGRRLKLETYLQLEHIQVSSRRHGPGLEDFHLARTGQCRRVRLRCQHHAAAARVVATTDLLLTLPERYARLVEQPDQYRVEPLPLDMSPLELHLYWHANAEHDKASQWLRERIVAVLAQR